MKRNENIWLFLMPIVIRKHYRLANGNASSDNHGGGQAMLLSPKDHRTRCAIGLCVREHKLDLTRPDESGLDKGYNQALQIFLTVKMQFLTCTVTWA